MASAGKKPRYNGRGAVYGDLAYELEQGAREHAPQRSGAEPRRRPRKTPPVKRVQTGAQERTRPRQRLSLLSLAGGGVVAALAVLLLMSYIELTEISAGVVELRNQLAALEETHVTLTAEYEQMFDLDTVRKAAEAAGMGKPSSSQIFYVDLSGGDNVVVHQQEGFGIFSWVVELLDGAVSTLLEYLS